MYRARKSVCDGLVYWDGPGVAMMGCVGRVLLSGRPIALTLSLLTLSLPLPDPLFLLEKSGAVPLLLHVGRADVRVVVRKLSRKFGFPSSRSYASKRL